MTEYYDPLAAPKPTINTPNAPPRTASKGILGEDMEDNVPLAVVAQHLIEDEQLLAKAEGMKDGGDITANPGHERDPTVPIVEIEADGTASMAKIPSMEGLDLDSAPSMTTRTIGGNDDSSTDAAIIAAFRAGQAVPIISSASKTPLRADEPMDDERASVGNASTTALASSFGAHSSNSSETSPKDRDDSNSVNHSDFYANDNSHINESNNDQRSPQPTASVVTGERTHLSENERSVTGQPPPPEAESNLAGAETAPGVHPAEAKLQTEAGQTPWAFARSAALKEKFKQMEAPITGIPGTKENPKKDPAYLSGTYRSCERSDKELNEKFLPNIAQFLMSLDPYINVAIITGGALGGWMIGNWGWSWVWTCFAGVCLALYVSRIRTSMSRAVDFEKKRNEATLKLGENVESAEWVNFFIAQLWPIIDPGLFTAAIDTLEDQFIAQAPSFITRINIADFELGPRAPRITSMQVYPGASGEDAVLMDLTVAMHPSPQELASRTRLNTHILINIHLGHPKLGSITVPIIAESAGFEAQIRVWLRFTSNAPFVKTLKFTLLNKPQIDFAIRPLKLGNLMNMPILSQFIMGVVEKTVEDMLVSPKIMALELDRILMGDAAIGDTRALGVVKFVFRQAKHLRAADWSGSSDPYATVSFGNASTFLARTRIISRDRNPMWNETHYAVITEDDIKNGFPLSVKVWDYDAISRNEVLGQFEIRTEEVVDSEGVMFDGWKTLLRKNQAEDASKPDVLERNGKLNFQLGFYPKVDLHNKAEAAKKYKSGILAVQIHQALDLILRPKDKNGLYPSPYIHAFVNDQLAFKTRIKHDNPSPVWAFTQEFFVRDWTRTILRLVVKDSRQHEHDPVIGVVVVKLSDVFKNDDDMMTSSWHNLQGGIGFGKIRVSAGFRSVQMEEPENMMGFNVGELEVKDFTIKGLEKITKDRSTPPSNIRIRIRSPITQPARLATKVCHPATLTPHWDDKLSLKVNSRYQTALRFEVYQKGRLGFNSKILAVGKMYLQDMVDNHEREVVLGLKRWKGANKKKDDDEEDHLGTTDKQVLRQELAAEDTTKEHPQGAEAAQQGLATDISGDRTATAPSAGQQGPESADKAFNQSNELQLPQSSTAGSRRNSATHSRASSISGTVWSDTDSDEDDQDVRDDNMDAGDDDDSHSVASFSDDSLAPEANPLTTIHSSPELCFKAIFRPGRHWIETRGEGEDVEVDELDAKKTEEEGGPVEEEEEDTADSAAAHPRGADKTNKHKKLFTLHTSTSPSDRRKSKDASASGAKEDSRLPGNKLSRTLEWSKDTVMEGVKSTRLWKKSSKRSLTLAGQEF
ncbi:hypothetical protein PhCBS80983_g04131 [Powellomyces hirtus]|uniref:C2 domain-containing protein n=1 Tax=Powellomyces hirtus TaxID=109895 RepID=A0A507DZE8_9FUNG|nr:hypothetical protein PhCBS80983_g04131 [Powellomyces hirtus]